MRICDLKLKIAGTELESRIDKFYAELAAKGISLKPICYLGDEWFCPEGSATIAIPFYLAHPRLKKLEEKMMMEVEGGTETWCLATLAPRDGPCPQSRLPAGEGQTLAKTIRADVARNIPKAFARGRTAAASCATWKATTPRATRKKISPRRVAIWLDARSGMATAVSRLEGVAKTRVRR